MANMSYCRFFNTRRDLDDCLNVLNEEYDDNSISEDEQFEAFHMLEQIANFLLDEELITEDGEFDRDACKEMLVRHNEEVK